MAGGGWFNLEAGDNPLPGTSIFPEESAYNKFFQLSIASRVKGFIAWYGPIFIECTLY